MKGLAAVAGMAALLSVLHHGHVAMFIADVTAEVRKKLRGRRLYRIEVEPSRLRLRVAGRQAFYEVRVQRKTRAVDVAIEFEGAAQESARWSESLAQRAMEIHSKLGTRVGLERPSRRRARLRESFPVPGKEWRPKVGLTRELVETVAERLLRFVEVLEPMLAGERVATPVGKRPRRGAADANA